MTNGASGPPADSSPARASTSSAAPGLDRPAGTTPRLEAAGDVPGDRLVADPQRLARQVVEIGRRASTISTIGRSASTTQPSHVPNDDPAGIDSEPGTWATA